MIIYIIGNKLAGYLDNPTIHTFQGEMFCGENIRYVNGLLKPDYNLGEEIKSPMKLIKNVYKMPDLFSPHSTVFVVSEKLRKQLAIFPHIEFVKVEFIKLFEFPYEPNDFSFYDIKGFKNPESFIKKQRHNKKLKDQIGDYYEMVIARYQDFADKFKNLNTCKLSIDYFDDEEMNELGFSKELLDEYPIFWEWKTILTEPVFDVLKDYIDPNYYFVKQYDLSEGPNPQSKMII